MLLAMIIRPAWSWCSRRPISCRTIPCCGHSGRGGAGRGVDMILPERVDSLPTRYASRSYYDELLDIGVRIHLYQKGLLHTKSITADRRISMFGTVEPRHAEPVAELRGRLVRLRRHSPGSLCLAAIVLQDCRRLDLPAMVEALGRAAFLKRARLVGRCCRGGALPFADKRR